MPFITTCHEETVYGREHHAVISIAPVAYPGADGYLRRIIPDWADGDSNFPHIITAAKLKTYTAADGMRRICPTSDLQRYAEIGAPYIKVGGVWTRVSLGTPTRTANKLSWTTANADVYVQHVGHYIKLGVLLKTNWRPANNMFAFPVGLNGLTRNGNQLLADGVPVMSFRPFHVEDADNPMDVRQVVSDFVQVGGQWYVVCTLPTLEPGKRWLLDPTLVLQPDAAAGKDTAILEALPTFNCGARGFAWIYSNRKMLLGFNLSSINATALCTTATLALTVNAGAATQQTITVYGISTANGDWIEGTQVQNLAASGEPCWNAKVADGAGGVTTAWAGSAGLSTAITDYLAATLGSWTWFVADGVGTVHSNALTPATVQSWFGTATNNGMLIVGSDAGPNDPNYADSDHATAAYHPMLTVDWIEAVVATTGRTIAYIPGFSTIVALPGNGVVVGIQ